jgi:hypothetical protein
MPRTARVEALAAFSDAVLRAAGADAPSAEAATWAMLHASLHGVESHGIRLLPWYADCLRNGIAKGSPRVTVTLKRRAAALVDADDGLGHVAVESEHTARWRLLLFTGTLATRLRIAQNFNTFTASFALTPGGSRALREFHGTWAVQAADDDASSGSGSGDEAAGCWVHLDQLLQPAVPLPPPLGFLLKRIAANQVRGIFADLRAEAGRIHAGTSTLNARMPSASFSWAIASSFMAKRNSASLKCTAGKSKFCAVFASSEQGTAASLACN